MMKDIIRETVDDLSSEGNSFAEFISSLGEEGLQAVTDEFSFYATMYYYEDEGSKQVIAAMLKDGVSLEKIADYIGWEIEDVKRLVSDDRPVIPSDGVELLSIFKENGVYAVAENMLRNGMEKSLVMKYTQLAEKDLPR
jgi:hypothetical protein